MNPDAPLSRRDVLKVSGAAGATALLANCARPAAGARDPSRVRIIDSHVHVWKDDPRYPWPKELKKPPAENALPSTLLDLMQANGVEKTVIVHVIYYRWDCRYAGDAIKANPRKFTGVCRVDPTAASAADDLSRWVREQGFHGVRLSPYPGPSGDWIKDRKLDELKKLLALARYPRVFVKISHPWRLSKREYPHTDTYDQIRRIYDAFGARRLMWGSDWPAVESFCGYGRALALYRDEIPFFSPEDRRHILGGTALRLWPFSD